MDAPDQKIEDYQLATLDNQGEPTALDIIRTETVLSRLPIHNLAKKGRVDIRIIKTTPTGEVELKWEVSYNERYGQARQLAYKLDTIIINRRIDEKGRPLPEIIRIGSLNEICEELGSQKNELKRALQQNATTAINAKLTYKGNDRTERQLEALFTRYSVIFTGEKLPSGKKADAVYIILNKPYREVLDNAPVRPLDREYMKQLPPAAQRFYEIISYRIFSALKYNHPHAKLAYSEYCMFSAQHRSLDWEFVRSQMYQVHQPHVKSGYLVKPIRHDKTTDGEGNLDWVFYYTPGPKARAEFDVANRGKKKTTTEVEAASANGKMPRRPWQARQKLSPELKQAAAVNADHLAALVKRGVTENQAREYLANISAVYPLIDTLEWADAEIAKNPGKWDNPAGWYVSLVKGRVIPPPTYETRAHREARIAADRKQQEEREAEQDRLAAEEQAEEQKLDDLQATNTDRYQALFRQCEEDLYRDFPSMMRFGKPDSSLHIGSVRSRMKRLLREQPAQEQGRNEVSFSQSLAELASATLAPADVSLETTPPIGGDPLANGQMEVITSDPPVAVEDGGEADQHSPTPTEPAREPVTETAPTANLPQPILFETSSAPSQPADNIPQAEPVSAAVRAEDVIEPPQQEERSAPIEPELS